MIEIGLLQRYFNERLTELGISNPTTEDLNRLTEEWIMMQNGQSEIDFDGLTPQEMDDLIYNLFGDTCIVQFADFNEEVCQAMPLFRQVKMILNIIENEESLKLTKTGNIPVKYIKELYALGAPCPNIETGFMPIRIETDSYSIQVARIALHSMGAIKTRHNALSLTKAGKKLLNDDCAIAKGIITALFSKLNSAYFDGYPYELIGNVGHGFTLLLLHRYGNNEEHARFYGKKFFNALPSLREEELSESGIVYSSPIDCFELRVLYKLYYNLGFISIDRKGEKNYGLSTTIMKTDLLDALFKFTK